MDVVGPAERRVVADPAAHGAGSSHDPESVPIGYPVPEAPCPQRIVELFQPGPGHQPPVHALAHVCGSHEQDPGPRSHLLEIIHLGLHPVDIFRDGLGGTYPGHRIAPVLEDDQAGAGQTHILRHEGRVYPREYVSRTAPDGLVVHGNPARAVKHDPVDLRRPFEGERTPFDIPGKCPGHQRCAGNGGIEHLRTLERVTSQGEGESRRT